MKYISFKLEMPNRASWNNRWSGQDRNYWIVKKISEKMYKTQMEILKDMGWCYDFGDGWTAWVGAEVIDEKEYKKRKKNTVGFSGYDWMVNSILRKGEITK